MPGFLLVPPLPQYCLWFVVVAAVDEIAGLMCTESTRSIGIQCQRAPIAFYQCWRLSEKKFRFLTGVTQDNFEVLYQFLGGDEMAQILKYYSYKKKTPTKPISSFLEPRDRLFMTLLRLRRGVPIVDLSHLFGIGVGSACAICYTWTRVMSLQFQRFQRDLFVTCEVQDTDPNPLFEKFPNLRVIVDATEFKIQRPFHFQMQSNTYSEYKGANTLKYVIGISRSGAISFVSKGYEGSCSDKHMIRECGFLDLLQEDDGVMVDRGFDIEPELNKIKCHLYMPPFKGKRKHVTAREEMKSKAITSVRAFVEIANSRIRDFRLIRGVIPMKLLPVMDDLVLIACMLTNMGEVYVPQKDNNNNNSNADEEF
ncbi:uncharacterized protein LOC113217046 [Frankliniella occidentalis]|uniref:Uncharacterized protein LOC113217046 n=1 Tax=Frankliniella occidentalis TaxID=133901 RepID=A0A9C6XU50_FRAOC|nr:uncharacterized protein LOC113217046 [Frankliniella occidentalis]